jgi:N utilization substance protein A
VKAIINELQGEKIDIVLWSSDIAKYVVNAISSVEVSKVVIDEERKRVEIVVPDDQLSLAIGRKGQNVRLASQLTGWNIDILTENEESKRRVEEFNSVFALFEEALDIEQVMAQLLAAEGFSSIEDIAYIETRELASIEGFDEDLAQELQSRARSYLDNQQDILNVKVKDLDVTEELVEFTQFKAEDLIKLGEHGVKTVQDLADLSRDEFIEMFSSIKLPREEIDKLIMKARNFINE